MSFGSVFGSLLHRYRQRFEVPMDESGRQTLRGEINYEAGRVFYLVFVCSVFSLPFIPHDLSMHQMPWLSIVLKLTVFVICAGLVAMRFTRRYRHEAIIPLKIMLICLFAMASIIMGTAGAQANTFIAPFSLAFIVPAFTPFSPKFKWLLTFFGVALFIATGALFDFPLTDTQTINALATMAIAIAIMLTLSTSQYRSRLRNWERRKSLNAAAEKLERALENEQKSDHMFRLLLTSAPFGIEVWEQNGTLVGCNDRLIEMLGAENEAQFIANYYNFYCPEVQPNGITTRNNITAQLTELYTENNSEKRKYERLYFHHTGEEIPVEVIWTSFVLNGKEMAAAYVGDLRPQLQKNKDTMQLQQRLQIILDSSPLLCSIFDENLDIIEANQAAANMFGLDDKSVYVERLWDLCPEFQPDGTPSQEKAEIMLRYAFQEGSADFDWVHCTLDKSTSFPCEVHMRRVSLSDSQVVLCYVRDVREQHILLEYQASDQERRNAMLDSSPLVAIMYDENLECINVNRKVEEIFSILDKQLFADDPMSFSPEFQPGGGNSRVMNKEAITEAFDVGNKRHEWVFLDALGEQILCEETMERVRFGERYYVLSYLRDLREQYKLKELQEQEERRLRSALDSAPFVFTFLDENFRVEDVNQQGIAMFGAPSRLHFIENTHTYYPQKQPCGTDSIALSTKLYTQAMETGHATFEWTYRAYDGEKIPTRETLRRVDFSGRTMLFCYTLDLRDQLRLQAMEKTDQERLQATMDASPMVCTIYNNKLVSVSVNQKVESLFGIPDKQIYLNDITRFFPDVQPDGTISDLRHIEHLAKAFNEGFTRYEWMYQRLDGTPIPCEETIQRVHIGDEEYVFVYTHDLRHQKKMMAELQQSAMNEQLANQAKTRFLARMSHEIRTPLNSVLGIAELELHKDTHPADTEESFNRIYNSSNMLLSIINDILDLSKVEAGKMEIVPNTYDTSGLIIDTAQLNLMHLGSKPIAFKMYVNEKLPAFLRGDELRVKQVLTNILSNAFKYTDEGSVSLDFDMEKGTDKSEVIIIITVTDSGQGMSSEQVSALSTEYSRFNLNRNQNIQGTGLGLSIAFQLIDMMGGSVEVRSRLGRGSTFTVRLPQGIVNDQIIGAQTAGNIESLEATKLSLSNQSKLSREPMPYGRVLLVDDVESNIFVAKGFLIPYKLQIDAVDCGQLAIDKINDGEVYDVIFMDHMMPGMDGMETTLTIRELGYTHPIVALTANAFSDMAQMFIENGFTGYMSKPIDIHQLDKILMTHIYEKQSPETISRARKAKQHAQPNNDPPPDITESLAASFLRDAKRSLDILNELVADQYNDIKMFTIQVHAMKSALRNIGHNKLANKGDQLEQAGRDTNLPYITDHAPLFIAQLTDIVNELAATHEQTYASVDNAENLNFLHQQLLILAEACENYDIATANDCIKSLGKITFTKEPTQQISKIFELLLSGDFEDAGELAKAASDRW